MDRPPERGPTQSLVGAVLEGRYRVDRAIGEGGFGTVYAGLHLALDLPIAIKTFKLPEATSAEHRAELFARFIDEARIITRLRHDNIVRMLDQGFLPPDESGRVRPFAVMELCPEGSLRQLLEARRGVPLPLETAIPLIEGIIEGVRHAHEQGVVHRDLKPANVMVTKAQDGTLVPRIIDFGIAKLLDSTEEPGSGTTRTRATAIAFTPAYAAPEQAIGGRTGPWTDVHAIGLIFCEVLTGKAPYQGNDPSLGAIDPIRPSPLQAGVDAGPFESLIARCLAIRPDQRFRDALELSAAFHAAVRSVALMPTAQLRAPELTTTAAGVSRRTMVLAAGTAGTAGLLVWLGLRRGEARDVVTASESLAPSAAVDSGEAPSAEPTQARVSPPAIALSALNVDALLARMVEAGLVPLSPPARDTPPSPLMINFRQASSMGAVYLNQIAVDDSVAVETYPMVALIKLREWIASDRQQGFELAYAIQKNWVVSMSWGPKANDSAAAIFEQLVKGLRFDARGCSWRADNPAFDANLTRPLWAARKLSNLSPVELLFRLEAAGMSVAVAVHDDRLAFSLKRAKQVGELTFFLAQKTNDNPTAEALMATLGKRKLRFLFARDGSSYCVAHGALVDAALISEVFAGVDVAFVSPPQG